MYSVILLFWKQLFAYLAKNRWDEERQTDDFIWQCLNQQVLKLEN